MLFKKDIVTTFVMSYPAISVYEFDFIKEEKDVVEYLRSSSIYLICQRPVLYFDEMYLQDGQLQAKIKQRGRSNELIIKVAFNPNDFSLPDEEGFWVNIEFFDKDPQRDQPYSNVAGIKLLDPDHRFLMWLSPERLLFEWLHGRISAEINGDFHDFITYTVHYIGQAQDQNIAVRLTGHESLQKVLTREHPFIDKELPSFELSLLFLKLDHCTQFASIEFNDDDEAVGLDGKSLSEKDIANAFLEVDIDGVRQPAVNDLEAFLINMFEPKYNKIKYKSYPRIKNGLKAAGYNEIIHQYVLCAKLVTEEATYDVHFSPIYGH